MVLRECDIKLQKQTHVRYYLIVLRSSSVYVRHFVLLIAIFYKYIFNIQQNQNSFLFEMLKHLQVL